MVYHIELARMPINGKIGYTVIQRKNMPKSWLLTATNTGEIHLVEVLIYK